jgi:signal transduction histidine kinase
MTEQTTRWAALAVLVLFLGAGASLSDRDPVVIVLAVVVALVAAVFQQTTGWRLLATCFVAGAAVTVLCAGVPSNIGWFDLCALAGWCAFRGGAMPGGVFTAAVTVLMAYQWIVVEDDGGWAAWIAGTVFTVIVALMARKQGELIDELRAAQAGLADQARAEERNRIARELHDVIGHALTVSQLHVSSARLAVEEDPAGAIASLAEAERLGQQSLSEVRHAVGLLREDGGSSMTSPLPGVEQLPVLVDGFRRAGMDISYDVVGDPARLPATVGITVYRILQEALTNVARHAAGSETQVRIEVGPAHTALTVDSTGAPGPGNRNWVGLAGMRERAEVLGGHLAAGPADHGWRVRAELPGGAVTGESS